MDSSCSIQTSVNAWQPVMQLDLAGVLVILRCLGLAGGETFKPHHALYVRGSHAVRRSDFARRTDCSA